jgi:hypothetical protein
MKHTDWDRHYTKGTLRPTKLPELESVNPWLWLGKTLGLVMILAAIGYVIGGVL